MFDVPPPVQLVGIDAYREAWPEFFKYQRGGVFRWHELHVVAGEEVAFCFGIITCGAADPATHFPVRLSIGLHKRDGSWRVAHEHHSVPAGGA